MPYSGVLQRYGRLLDLPAHTTPVTLLEGDTPLIPMPRLARELGSGFELWVKFEGLNPSGSFKDRGMTAAISESGECLNRVFTNRQDDRRAGGHNRRRGEGCECRMVHITFPHEPRRPVSPPPLYPVG